MVSKEISVTKPVTRLIIGNNVKVNLIADGFSPSITVTCESNLLADVNVKIKGEEMIIYSSKNIQNHTVFVHVPVKDLAYLELKSGSFVSVEGAIQCTNLMVWINADSHLELRYKGKATITAAEDCEFVYERAGCSVL